MGMRPRTCMKAGSVVSRLSPPDSSFDCLQFAKAKRKDLIDHMMWITQCLPRLFSGFPITSNGTTRVQLAIPFFLLDQLSFPSVELVLPISFWLLRMGHSRNVLSFNCWVLYRKGIRTKNAYVKYMLSVRNPSPICLPKHGHPIWSGDIAVYTCLQMTKWQREWFNSQNFIVNSHLSNFYAAVCNACAHLIFIIYTVDPI